MSDRLRVLLWSVHGAGAHYGGPGTSAKRLYGTDPGRFDLHLAHGRVGHEQIDLFSEQTLVAPFRPGILGQLGYISAANRWMSEHASRFDVIHALQGFEFTVNPCLAAADKGTPSAVKLVAHNSDLAEKGGWRGMLKIAGRRREKLKRLAAVIAISRPVEQELLEYGFDPERIAFIPNGVDIDRFAPSSKQPGEVRACLGLPDRSTLLCVGQVVPRKRQHLLIDAISLAVEQGTDAQLVLVGPEDPEYLQQIRSDAASKNLTERIVHVPFTDDPRPYYHAADAYALVSMSEGMPNSVLEAMSCSLPVVGTRVSGTTDLVSDGVTGALVDADQDLIAECASGYLSNKQLAHEHGRAGRSKIIDHYSSRFVLDQHERLFEAIRDGHSPADAVRPRADASG